MKSYRTHLVWFSLVALGVVVGCDSGASSGGGSDMDALAAQLDQAKQAEANAKAAAEAAAAKAAADKQAAEEAARRAAAANNTVSGQSPNGDSTANGVVGQKQRRNTVEGPLRYYGAMANARIIAMDRAIGWQIKKSMDVWVNTHDGKYPKTTEEFMREIIEPNMIALPELEPKQEFYFDPEDHELKIVELIDEPAGPPPAGE
jgi:pyruvate/2-oxoglutarate dehydrogenase complex dihydrolipoamide acyltransferase (E2) component